MWMGYLEEGVFLCEDQIIQTFWPTLLHTLKYELKWIKYNFRNFLICIIVKTHSIYSVTTTIFIKKKNHILVNNVNLYKHKSDFF